MPSHADDSGHLTGRGSGVSGLGSEQVAEVGVDPAGAALISQRGRLLIRSRRRRRYANLDILFLNCTTHSNTQSICADALSAVMSVDFPNGWRIIRQ